MNRWYLDTEFLEDGVTIDLISIALVSEDGATEYYAGNAECSLDRVRANPWLLEHVVPHLPPFERFHEGEESAFWKPKAEIGRDLLGLFNIVRGVPLRGKPEIWADFASYDWVAFCQIYGRMIDLPAGLPMFCMEFMQELRQLRIKRSELPKQDPATKHSAIWDARWLRRSHIHAQVLAS